MGTVDPELERILSAPRNYKRPSLLLQLLKALVGLIAILIVHLPRLLFRLLMVSYAWVFNHHDNLTADPKEHLKRAKRLLKKKRDHSVLQDFEKRRPLFPFPFGPCPPRQGLFHACIVAKKCAGGL